MIFEREAIRRPSATQQAVTVQATNIAAVPDTAQQDREDTEQGREDADLDSEAQPRPGYSIANIAILPPAYPLSHPVVRRAIQPAATSDDDHAASFERRHPHALVAEALSGDGRPLDEQSRAAMAPRFGYDFSRVRIYDDARAAESAAAMQARAYTLGGDIVFGRGQYAPETHDGQRLIAHELAHVVQQRAVPVPDVTAPATLEIGDPADGAEEEAERAADAATEPVTETGARTALPGPAMSPPIGTIQRAPASAAPAAPTTMPSEGEINAIAMRLKADQNELESFLAAAKQDVANIREYFRWVNGVYERTYGHYALVIRQAAARADSQQEWADAAFGLAIGISVGVLAEASLGAKAADTAFEILVEIGAEGVENAVGVGASKAGLKPEVPRAKVSEELLPAFKQVAALQQLDDLNQTVLALAVPGTFVYTDPLVQATRLASEVHIAQTGGSRQLSDDDVRKGVEHLKKFAQASATARQQLDAAKARFEALRKAYMGKQAPSDQRCEQDIWIPWIARQDGSGSLIFGSVLTNKVIANHLVDIGMAARGVRGGRLNADVENSQMMALPMNADPDVEPLPAQMEMTSPAYQLKLGAAAQEDSVRAFWKDVFLMTS